MGLGLETLPSRGAGRGQDNRHTSVSGWGHSPILLFTIPAINNTHKLEEDLRLYKDAKTCLFHSSYKVLQAPSISLPFSEDVTISDNQGSC